MGPKAASAAPGQWCWASGARPNSTGPRGLMAPKAQQHWACGTGPSRARPTVLVLLVPGQWFPTQQHWAQIGPAVLGSAVLDLRHQIQQHRAHRTGPRGLRHRAYRARPSSTGPMAAGHDSRPSGTQRPTEPGPKYRAYSTRPNGTGPKHWAYGTGPDGNRFVVLGPTVRDHSAGPSDARPLVPAPQHRGQEWGQWGDARLDQHWLWNIEEETTTEKKKTKKKGKKKRLIIITIKIKKQKKEKKKGGGWGGGGEGGGEMNDTQKMKQNPRFLPKIQASVW